MSSISVGDDTAGGEVSIIMSLPKKFKVIGIVGKIQKEHISETLDELISFLKTEKISLVISRETGSFVSKRVPMLPFPKLVSKCDFLIVVGGDGSMLNVARETLSRHLPILGVNLGRLGFLADVRPEDIKQKIKAVLNGNYLEEERFLLEAKMRGNTKKHLIALNEIVLAPGRIAQMLEFEVYLNNEFMYRQRSDGIIIATPTGSTAYALSAGGPILHPSLNAIVLVPVFPHSLTYRPIVVDGDSHISIVVTKKPKTLPQIIGDSQARFSFRPGDVIDISKAKERMRLIHPRDYRYFDTLRSKLHWGKQVSKE